MKSGGWILKIKTLVHSRLRLRTLYFFIGFAFSCSMAVGQNAETANSILHPQFNHIQFYQRQDIALFIQKMDSAQKHKVRILHIGDEHLKENEYHSVLKDNLQRKSGYGGFGFVFL